MHDASTIAHAILGLVDPELEVISNLKLQKLLYYAQGFNLAAFNKPLFRQKILAWQYGPVVRQVYDSFKSTGAGAIPLTSRNDVVNPKKLLTKDEFRLFKDVYDVYSQFSALRLMEMTHNEPPWKSTKINDEITHKKLKDFFSTRLIKGGTRQEK